MGLSGLWAKVDAAANVVLAGAQRRGQECESVIAANCWCEGQHNMRNAGDLTTQGRKRAIVVCSRIPRPD